MNKQQKNKGYKQLIYIYISHVNVTQTVPDISPLMPMHQDPLLVDYCVKSIVVTTDEWLLKCSIDSYETILKYITF